MMNEPLHLSDEELLLLADGELSSQQEKSARSHLASCWSCRARFAEFEKTIADFVRTYHDSTPEFPSGAGPRALLQAQLAELAAKPIPQPP